MRIYEHRTSTTISSGSTATVSLNVLGGILRQVIVRALTSNTTAFRTNLVDASLLTRKNWGFHRGEINDDVAIPVSGRLTLNITNVSPDDVFAIYLGVQE